MKISCKSEKDLIVACINGEQVAWQELYKHYFPIVTRTVNWSGWSFSVAEREELVQDVFLELVEILPSFREQSSLSTFIIRIAKNHCISLLRKKTAQKRGGGVETVSIEEMILNGGSVSIDGDGKFLDPLIAVLNREDIAKFEKTFEHIDESCRKILHLRYIDDKSYDEICHDLSLPLGTVCSRIKRCIISFKKIYEHMQKSNGVESYGYTSQ